MRFRAPVPGDAQAVLALHVARDTADLGAPDYTLEDLRADWSATEFDLADDALVVEAEDRSIVAYAVIRRPGTEVIVASGWEERGIGTRLLTWVEQRDRACGRESHRQGVAATNKRAREFLLAAGYRPERSYLRMGRRLCDLAGADSLPVEVTVRSLDADADAEAVFALDRRSFADVPDYRPVSFVSFCEEHLQAHDLDPELSAIAMHGHTTVAFLVARRWQEASVGFVDLLAVHPDYQCRGLGTAMLQAAFVRFAAAGLREAQLGVASDNPRALRLYERCEMAPRFRFDAYARAADRACT